MGFIESAELPAKLADQQSESQTKQTAKKKKGKTNQIQSILYGGRPESVNVQSLESNSQDEEHVLASTVFVPDAQKSDPSQFASQPLSLILETQEANLPELSPSKFSGIFLEICCGVNRVDSSQFLWRHSNGSHPSFHKGRFHNVSCPAQ